MPVDYPDFGAHEGAIAYPLMGDLGELAVRLGSIVEYDRRGVVVDLDDFEAAVPHFTGNAATNAYARLDQTYVYSGSQSCKLYVPATSGKWASILWNINPLVVGSHGSKITLSMYNMEAVDSDLEFMISMQDTVYRKFFGVRLNLKNKTLEYRDTNSSWTVFETNFNRKSLDYGFFHNMKLVVDLDKNAYVRFMFDTDTWDMSAYSLTPETVNAEPYNQTVMQLKTNEATALIVYADNFVYTINE